MLPDHARPQEIEAAFHLLLRHLNQHDRDERVARALDLIHQGRMDARGLFVLRDRGAVCGVIAAELVAGAGAIIWPPVVGGSRGELEDRLVHHACDWLRQNGARLAQCLLPPREAPQAAPLLRHGFSRITRLSYLSHSLSLPAEALVGRLDFEAYDPDNPAVFHETLFRTYEGTLDCPEVNGVRTIEEVIEGHRAQGEVAPGRWQLARAGGEAIGVVLASQAQPGEEWDVGYMGLVPGARGRGFGGEMLLRTLAQARAAGAPGVTLCVDDRNLPAWRLYRRMGFTSYDSRDVFLTVWRRAS